MQERVNSTEHPHFDSSGIRRELFKFFYPAKMFELNKKGDATEALSFLLNILHYAKIRDKQGEVPLSQEHFDGKCGQDCFIHEHFYIKVKTERQCKCGKRFPEEQLTPNNFSILMQMGGENGFLA